jgi:hypothetical protein
VFMIASSTPATVSPSHDMGASLLRPNCNARDRLLRWRGVNTPPQSTIADPWIRGLGRCLRGEWCNPPGACPVDLDAIDIMTRHWNATSAQNAIMLPLGMGGATACGVRTYSAGDHPSGFGRPHSTMPTSTTSWGSSLSQHLRAAKEVLQHVAFYGEYVRDSEISHLEGLKFKFAG